MKLSPQSHRSTIQWSNGSSISGTNGYEQRGNVTKPTLKSSMSVVHFKSHYWTMTQLLPFARRLGICGSGWCKPELVRWIERRLRGLDDRPRHKRTSPEGPRDSDRTLTRKTAVRVYKSDDKTRAFFESEIGRHFHFTYRLNQYRLAHSRLTYGDLVDEWQAEHARRTNPEYRAPIANHGKYNRDIRDFFADASNAGKTLADAAASWNRAKHGRGDHRYRAKR